MANNNNHPLRYHIYTNEKNTNQQTYLFKCKEDTESMINVKPDMRPFNLSIKSISSLEDYSNEDFSNPFARLDKPFLCCWCCNNKPTMKGIIMKDKQQIGSAKENCMCCSPLIDVFDNQSIRKWRITKKEGYCKAFCCRGCMCCLSDIELIILKNNGEEMGSIIETYKAKGSKENKIEIRLPKEATIEEKFMIMGVAMMYDYKYYHFGY